MILCKIYTFFFNFIIQTLLFILQDLLVILLGFAAFPLKKKKKIEITGLQTSEGPERL